MALRSRLCRFLCRTVLGTKTESECGMRAIMHNFSVDKIAALEDSPTLDPVAFWARLRNADQDTIVLGTSLFRKICVLKRFESGLTWTLTDPESTVKAA